jgi:hypothetical protein
LLGKTNFDFFFCASSHNKAYEMAFKGIDRALDFVFACKHEDREHFVLELIGACGRAMLLEMICPLVIGAPLASRR